MSTTKVHFTLADEAIAIINRRAPSENKRGQWISQAIIDYDAILSGAAHNDHDAGVLEQIVNRLDRLEKMVAALVKTGA